MPIEGTSMAFMWQNVIQALRKKLAAKQKRFKSVIFDPFEINQKF